MKTSIFYYCAFAFVVLGSVLFGLDWQPATMSPMPPIQVVALPPPPPPAAPAPVKPAVPVAVPNPSAPNPSAPNPAAPRPVAPKLVAPNPVPASPLAPAPATPTVTQTPPAAKCDVAACAAAYRSFRESDCTYNPSFGERRLCTKGVVPNEAATAPASPAASDAQPSIMQTEPNTQTNVQPNTKCNVSACAAAYRSFRESDCTFNPSFGPRQICAK